MNRYEIFCPFVSMNQSFFEKEKNGLVLDTFAGFKLWCCARPVEEFDNKDALCGTYIVCTPIPKTKERVIRLNIVFFNYYFPY